MLCLESSGKGVGCETAHHDQHKSVEEWPEWRQEFYKECPSSVYRLPYNEEGLVPLFFVTDKGRQEYDAAAVGHAILKHMVARAWFPLLIFDTTVLQNMCDLTMDNTVTTSELLRLVHTTDRFQIRLNSMVDMLVEKSREIDRGGWSNIQKDTGVAGDRHNHAQSLFHNFGLHIDQHIFVVDTVGLVATTEKLVLHHSSIEFRIRQLLSNWFCAWPYHQHLEPVPEFHHQHYNTRNVQIIQHNQTELI